MTKTTKLKTTMVTRYVKYFTKALLQETTRNANKGDGNSTVEAMNALADNCRYPVEQWFAHYNRHIEPAQELIRARVAMKHGRVATVNMPVDFWSRLPTYPVQVRKVVAKKLRSHERWGSILGYHPAVELTVASMSPPKCGPAYASPAGFHRHRCPQCGHVWEHSDEMLNDLEAHTCNKCGCGDGYWGDLDKKCWEHYCGPEAPSTPNRAARPVAA